MASSPPHRTHDGEQPRGEAGDQVLPSPSADDGVVGTGYRRPMVGCHHQAHLNELAGVLGQPRAGKISGRK